MRLSTLAKSMAICEWFARKFPFCNVPTSPNSRSYRLWVYYFQWNTHNTHRRYHHGHYQGNSWELEWKRPSRILETGYSKKNIIMPQEADWARLSKLGPSDRLISADNSSTSKASDKTKVWRPGLLQEAEDSIITPGVKYLLTSGTEFSDQGLIMYSTPHLEDVTKYSWKNIIISYAGKLMITGCCKQTHHCFWCILIEVPWSVSYYQSLQQYCKTNYQRQ